MGQLRTLTNSQERLAVRVLAIASACAVIVGNLSGIAVGDDGVGYTAISDSLKQGNGLGYFLERELTIWPPTWPALMSIVDRITPFGPVGSAVILNALTTAIVVFLAHEILRRIVRDQAIRLVTTAVIGLGGSTMLFGHLLMTDFAFIAVMLGLFIALMNYAADYDRRWLVGAAALVWLGFSIRYAGVVFLATGGLWILAVGDRKFLARLTDGVIFGAIGVSFPIAWILRNLSIDDTILGERYGSARGLGGNALDVVATLGNFLTPGLALEARQLWALVALVGISTMALISWKVFGRDERLRSKDGLVGLVGSSVGLLVLQVGVYTAYMLYARTTTGLNRLDFRLMNPIYLPLILVCVAVLDRAIRSDHADERQSATTTADSGDEKTLVETAAMGLFLSWAGLNLLIGIGMVGYFLTGPDLFTGNYQRDAFDEARESAALDVLPNGCEVMSNLPNALYDAGIEATWSPRLTGLESNDKVDDIAELRRDLGNGEHCLVWIDLDPTYGHLATLDRLNEEYTLEELASDGTVTSYTIQRK